MQNHLAASPDAKDTTLTIHLPLPRDPATGRVPSLLGHCRGLLAAGADPAASVLVYRGATLCFRPVPLASFAALSTEEPADRSIRFVRYRPRPAP